jgi:solute carrier family 35, member F5
VLASLAGIVLISGIDVYGSNSAEGNDASRGTFPHKSAKEIALGDALAFISAIVYGVYAVLMKSRIGDESRVHMPLFFGLVGLFNVLTMWPLGLFLHLTNVEPFEFPPTERVVLILLVNALSSVLADFCWAYAMLLTSPLIVTVGLSLNIPLSLVGQMILDGLYTGVAYWVGAGVVVGSFVFINHEESKDEGAAGGGISPGRARVEREPEALLRDEVDWQA